MTPGSITLLILAILSLNIIWGLPWVGMLSTCLSLMIVGGIAAAVVRPRLTMDVRVEPVAMAGRPVRVVATMRNPGPRSALDLRLTPRIDPAVGRTGDQSFTASSVGVGQSIELSFQTAFTRRGIWTTPPVRVESYFPFRLFRTFNRVASDRSVAVTPPPADSRVDPAAGSVARAVEQIVLRHRGGDQMNYVGNTEYRMGMPVRRWDFASWARLGRPIVRQYSAPATASVRLIVDVTGMSGRRRRGGAEDAAVEAVLARAVMAIERLGGAGVGLEVCVATDAGEMNPAGHSDRISIATAIAGAVPVRAAAADRYLIDCLARPTGGGGPTLILSTRPPERWSERTDGRQIERLRHLISSPLVGWYGPEPSKIADLTPKAMA